MIQFDSHVACSNISIHINILHMAARVHARSNDWFGTDVVRANWQALGGVGGLGGGHLQLNDDADLGGVTARYLRSPVPNTQWPSEAVVIWIAKVTAPEATVRKVELDMRHE